MEREAGSTIGHTALAIDRLQDALSQSLLTTRDGKDGTRYEELLGKRIPNDHQKRRWHRTVWACHKDSGIATQRGSTSVPFPVQVRIKLVAASAQKDS